jgi:S1-C subfamily serine protease
MSASSESKSGTGLAELSSQLANAVETAASSIVAIHARRRIPSSGIVWRDDVVVSANHTVRRDGDISITLPSGEAASATIIGRDAATDLVALRVNQAGLRVMPRADASGARIGSLVLAVGRPGKSVSASFGIISSIADGWRSGYGTRIDRVLRLDLAIYDGFSGGPLVSPAGGVVGVDTSTLARGAPVALPADVVDRVLDELLTRGHVRRPFIGIAVQPVALVPSVVGRHQLQAETALVVVSVAEGTPAETAGLTVGDVLVEANGQPLSRPTALFDALLDVADGGSLELKRLRGNAASTVTVTPVDRGDQGGAGGADE